jgi:hypothetical protein
MVSYRKDVTGIDHTVFISPKGHTRHGPSAQTGHRPGALLDYWEYRIDIEQLRRRLKPISVAG